MANASTNATSTALNTTELLEKIFLELPMVDIIRSKRVSRFWQRIILNSVSIRRYLFLEPVSSQNDLLAILPTALSVPSLEPLDAYYTTHLWIPQRDREDNKFDVRLIHPSLANIKTPCGEDPHRRENIIASYPQVEAANRRWSRAITDSSTLPLSKFDSRRLMFATQPPTKKIVLVGWILDGLFPRQVIEDPRGVRLGHIADTLRDCRESGCGVTEDEWQLSLGGDNALGMYGELEVADEFIG